MVRAQSSEAVGHTAGVLGSVDVHRAVALGANFSEIKKRRATDIGYLLARSDAEIGKIGPCPKGCEFNRAILCCRRCLGLTKAASSAASGPIFLRHAILSVNVNRP